MIAAIIGANSMLGMELARQLLDAGTQVLRIGRSADCDILYDLDATQVVEVDNVQAVDVIFHCASAFAEDSIAGQKANGMTNVLGCFNVLALMLQLRCGICIYAGSLSSTAGVEAQGRSSYGLSKALGEQVLAWGLMERQVGGVFCSLRFPQLYDVEGRCCRHQPWFGRIVAYASRGMDLHMPAPGGARNFLHVRDAARLLMQAWQEGVSGVWDIVHPESLDYWQIAQCAYGVFGSGGHIEIAQAKQPFRALNLPAGDALFDRLGMWPEISMEQGLKMIRDTGCAGAFGPLDVT
ncbi:NAD(P)-dependent oxidoreductase [Castellaniella ginsengisoli]|uniref:NAD(P)-dependent oxidoreductase n=2 Tax=Castellaniella ginsengisoli TaxID=546114 RepID=A0AB39FA15_9BURK